MPNKRTGPDYLDKKPKKKKTESLIERLKRRKEETDKAIKNM